jgi:hypothetical protein
MVDEDALIDIFSIPVKPKRKAKREYKAGNRTAHVNKEGSEWIGYFADDHSVEYIADTKKELLIDMGIK